MIVNLPKIVTNPTMSENMKNLIRAAKNLKRCTGYIDAPVTDEGKTFAILQGYEPSQIDPTIWIKFSTPPYRDAK